MPRTPAEEVINSRIIERGLDSRSDEVLVDMLAAVTEKSTAFDEKIDRLTNFPQSYLWFLKKDLNITGGEAQEELDERLQMVTDKKARLLDKKFLLEQEQDFRQRGKVNRVIIE